ncbi:MAG: flagellar biosynthesis protein FlhF [Steroidobacteraceae bacterium]
MKRYAAADMRTALRMAREELGPDAVILDTRESSTGVEVCVAVDYELAAAVDTPLAVGETFEFPGAPQLARQEAAPPVNSAVGEELRSLRQLLESQLAALAWNDFTRREPLRAQVLSELTTLGLGRDVALQLSNEMPADVEAAQLPRLAMALVARRINCCDSPVAQGGMLALAGPPGSGKTTTLAKLAVRWVLENPPHTLAIISADEERLGSHEQLRALGRLLQVPVFTVAGEEELRARLSALADVPLVLVDSAGVAMRDAPGMAQLAQLTRVHAALKTMLVLPASAQGGVLEEAVRNYAELSPCCAVLTRMDEASALGGVLSALVRSQLPVALLSDGPRIPEDLRPARAHNLVARAVELARQAQNSADEELLSRRFGGSLHDAA